MDFNEIFVLVLKSLGTEESQKLDCIYYGDIIMRIHIILGINKKMTMFYK